MSKRKIADCIDVLVNLGPFNHIQFTKYAEEEIEYDSDEERIAKEDCLRNDLVTRLLRDMKATTEMVGVGVAEVQKVEESVTTKIPAWLNGPAPNIANGAKKRHIQDSDNQEVRRDEAKARVDEFEEEFGSPDESQPADISESEKEDSPVKEPEAAEAAEAATVVDDTGNLFEDDELSAEPVIAEEENEVETEMAQETKEETATETEAEEKKSESKPEEDLSTDIFGSDDDIFGDL